MKYLYLVFSFLIFIANPNELILGQDGKDSGPCKGIMKALEQLHKRCLATDDVELKLNLYRTMNTIIELDTNRCPDLPDYDCSCIHSAFDLLSNSCFNEEDLETKYDIINQMISIRSINNIYRCGVFPRKECSCMQDAYYDVEEDCVSERDIQDKKSKLFQVQQLENKFDALGCENVTTVDCLCGNIYESKIEFEPSNEITLDVDDTVELKAFLYNYYCTNTDDRCVTEQDGEIVCVDENAQIHKMFLFGDIEWSIGDGDAVEVDWGPSIKVLAKKPGSVTIYARSVDLPDIMDSVIIHVGKKVDIVLVVESSTDTYDWMGFDDYKCPTALCLEPEPTVWTQNFYGWWGYPLGGATIYSGEVSVSDPSVILISRWHNGPWTAGPITIDYTYNELAGAWNPETISIIAQGVGTATVGTCISYNGPWCDPLDENQYTHQEKTYTVSDSKVISEENIGLRDIGSEIIDALEQRFDDYRFGLIGFGRDPELYIWDEEWFFPEWKPYAEPKPYYDWVPFTNDAETITQGISNLSIICDKPIDSYVMGNTAFTAMLHAIYDTPWRAGAEKVIILWQCDAVDHYNRTGEVELVSGNTLNMVVNGVLSENISLYTFMVSTMAEAQLQKLTQSTSGTYFGYVWPPLTALQNVFDDISSPDGSSAPKFSSNDSGNETTTDSGMTIYFESANLEEKEKVPTQYTLGQNYPNPFNPFTVIAYQLPSASNITLKVYDVLGKEVAILVNEKKPAGNYEVEFDATNLTSGIYFYTLKAGDYIETRKMILIK